jgi:uncharacterized protein
MVSSKERDDRKDFLGRGWAFPVARDPLTGRTAEAAFEEDIRQAIRIILETRRGERVMRADFGCGIHDLAFDTIEPRTLARIETEVRDALRVFEARIEVVDVGTDPSEAANGLLQVNIAYQVRRTNQTGNLVFPFYYREGGVR